jgi:hypothetical protein
MNNKKDKWDRLIGDVWKRIRGESLVEREPCIDEEILACYNENLLDEKEREKVEKHLLKCKHCLELVLQYQRVKEAAAQEELLAVPASTLKKAIDLVPEEKLSFFDVVLNFVKETINVISNPLNLPLSLEPAPVSVRGIEHRAPQTTARITKSLPTLELQVEVEGVEKKTVDLRVGTLDLSDKKPKPGLRVSLFDMERELASYISEEGWVLFEDLSYGKYIIKIKDNGKTVGQTSLYLMGPGYEEEQK